MDIVADLGLYAVYMLSAGCNRKVVWQLMRGC